VALREDGRGEPQATAIDVSRISGLLRFINWSSYGQVLICGNLLLTLLVQAVLKARSPGALAGYAAALWVTGLLFYSGWRNIGILNAVARRSTVVALIFLLLVSTVATIVGAAIVASGVSDQSRAGGVSSESFFRFTSFAAINAGVWMLGLFALWALRRATLPELSTTLTRVLRESPSVKATQKLHLKPINRNAGLVYAGFGIGWLILTEFTPEWFAAAYPQATVLLPQLGYFLLIYARFNFQPDFRALSETDRRPPVVFFRSFADDQEATLFESDRALLDFSLESRLAEQFGSLGPFIAVGKPGDSSVLLGAARASFSDAGWRDAVTDWMSRAVLIIVMLGKTHWVGWELQRIIALGYIDKLVVVFPQTRRPAFSFRHPFTRWNRAEDAAARLDALRAAFAGTEWAPSLNQIARPQEIRSLAFLPRGETFLVTSVPRNRESYQLAAVLARAALVRVSDATEMGSERTPTGLRGRWLWGAASGLAAVVVATFFLVNYIAAPTTSLVVPLPSSVPVKATGTLAVGDFAYLDGKGANRESDSFSPGDPVSVAYEILGFKRTTAGWADVSATARLVDSAGSPVSETFSSRFHEAIKADVPIAFTLSVTLAKTVSTGRYRFDFRVRDAGSGSTLEFEPTLRIETAGSASAAGQAPK